MEDNLPDLADLKWELRKFLDMGGHTSAILKRNGFCSCATVSASSESLRVTDLE